VSRKREEQSAVEAFWALGAPGPKKRLKRPDGELGLGGKGAENGPPGPPFSATFHRYVDLRGEKAVSHCMVVKAFSLSITTL
jgi:hypothetical protein